MKSSFKNQNEKSLVVNSYHDDKYLLNFIKIKINVFDLLHEYYSCLLFCFNAIILAILIIQIIFARKKLILDIFYGVKIYYKKEKSLNSKEIQNQIKNYKKFKISFDEQSSFSKNKNPKISLIITIYNQEYYLKYVYSSITIQELKDLEIIFIDDVSSDNSSKIIKNIMKKDKRINYIRNKINKNAFYSRNIGVLFSKGKYILIIDPDDLLLNNILIKSYENINYYDLDILQYYVFKGSYENNMIWYWNKYKSGILYSRNVKNVFFYSVSRTLWDKLIKREVFIKGINFMKKEFQSETYFVHSDDTIFWGIINSAKSYGFMEQIGYFYNFVNPDSTVHRYFDSNYINIVFHSLFATMKYYYFQTEENQIEKYFVGYKFFEDKVYKPYKNRTNNLSKGFDYIIDVLKIYLNSSFFNETQKMNLTEFKDLIIKRKISEET